MPGIPGGQPGEFPLPGQQPMEQQPFVPQPLPGEQPPPTDEEGSAPPSGLFLNPNSLLGSILNILLGKFNR